MTLKKQARTNQLELFHLLERCEMYKCEQRFMIKFYFIFIKINSFTINFSISFQNSTFLITHICATFGLELLIDKSNFKSIKKQ